MEMVTQLKIVFITILSILIFGCKEDTSTKKSDSNVDTIIDNVNFINDNVNIKYEGLSTKEISFRIQSFKFKDLYLSKTELTNSVTSVAFHQFGHRIVPLVLDEKIHFIQISIGINSEPKKNRIIMYRRKESGQLELVDDFIDETGSFFKVESFANELIYYDGSNSIIRKKEF